MKDARQNYYPEGTFGDDIEENARIIADFLVREKPGAEFSFSEHAFLPLQVDNRDVGMHMFMDALIPSEAMISFGKQFFEHTDLHEVLNQPSPSTDEMERSYDSKLIFSDDCGRSIRHASCDHLNPQQRETAEHRLSALPEIHETTHVMSHMISDYLKIVYDEMIKHPEAQTDEGLLFVRFANGVFNFAAFDEFERILAPSLALSERLDIDGQPVGKDFTPGIKAHLQGDLSGFESAEMSFKDLFKYYVSLLTTRTPDVTASKITSCPYQHAPGGFSTLWNTFFEEQADGSFDARSMAGGFFNSVMGALHPEHYPQFSGQHIDTFNSEPEA